MSKHLRWSLYNRLGKNKWGKMSKRYQEKWTRYLINYYKKPYKNISDIQERWEGLRAKHIADIEKEKLKKKLKIAHKYLIKDLRPMDSYGDKNIGSRIIKGKKYSLVNKSLNIDINHNKWLNYFNTKRTKYEIRRKDINPFFSNLCVYTFHLWVINLLLIPLTEKKRLINSAVYLSNNVIEAASLCIKEYTLLIQCFAWVDKLLSIYLLGK